MAKIAVVEDNDAMRAQLCGFIAQYAQLVAAFPGAWVNARSMRRRADTSWT